MDQFWDLVWLLTEEESRKLANEQRDGVLRVLDEQDASGVEVMSRKQDAVLLKIADVVFEIPVSHAWSISEAAEPLADEQPSQP